MCQANFFGDNHDGTSSQAIFSFHGNKHGNCLFALDPSFWGHKGVPPCWMQYTKLGPCFASSFDHNFQTNDNQTFIVYMKSTLVLYRKGPCVFSCLGFTIEEKLHGKKCCKYFRPEGVYDLYALFYVLLHKL